MSLKELIGGENPVWAPLVLNPMMARLAAKAGFRALYLGGGAMGYLNAYTEANLTLPEMAAAALNIRAVCELPLILDAAAGWGDPMHLRRTIPYAEAAGFAAIEIEDQFLPKRAHHHIGHEHNIPLELMVAKIEEAVATRHSPDFLVIARTNAVRNEGMDAALRRAEAMHKAGADMLFVLARTPEEWRFLGERLPAPLMYMVLNAGVTRMGISAAELHRLGYRLFVDPVMPLLAMHRALRQSYAALAAMAPDPLVGTEGRAEQDAIHETIELQRLLDIERRTTERHLRQ